MKYLMWLLRAAIFLTLFAFALNNEQVVRVYGFFGASWEAPLVLVVFAALTVGLALGAAAVLPYWWSARRQLHELPPQRQLQPQQDEF